MIKMLKQNKIFLILFLLLLHLFFIINVYGNGGRYIKYGNQGTLIPSKSKNISMVEENIFIDVYHNRADELNAYFSCKYIFKNKSKITQNIIMGFPIKFGETLDIDNRSEENPNPMIPLQNHVYNFDVKIDDIKTKYKIYDQAINPDLPNIMKYDILYGFDVNFQPEDEIEILITYNTYIIEHISGAGTTYPYINYVLKTATTWESPINKAVITVKFNFPYDRVINIEEKNYKYFRFEAPQNKIVFKFDNFSPQHDLRIKFLRKSYYSEYEKNKDLVINEFLKYYNDKNYIYAEFILDSIDNYLVGGNNLKDFSKEKLRNTFYWSADYFFRKDIKRAIISLIDAFKFSESNDYCCFDKPDKLLTKIQFENWIHEGESNAPCYYIAYNLACAYAIDKQLDKAISWLKIALKLKPELKNHAIKDNDLINIRNSSNYIELINQ